MNTARFSIGIDLGTTNCALAFAPLSADASKSEVMPVSQWDSATSLIESETLPSFLYLPGEKEDLRGKSKGGKWIVGRFAQNQTVANPGRVVQSAKSWLSTPAVDPTTKFLPWGGDVLAEADKISAIRASGLLLNYLKSAWDERFEAKFDEQEITITVPASFDASAQRLTLEAAHEAGFPKSVRLLEEPQAAFYRWMEAHESQNTLVEILPELGKRAHAIAVVDIGGGTSDFSLFEIRLRKHKTLPEIKRIAVSDHLLLGGDNIDLALAHVAQMQLETDLSADQWSHLIAQCRIVKEQALADPSRTTNFKVAVPGRGSGLIASTLSAELDPEDVQMVLFEGFYPQCEADDKPDRAVAGLQEFGLPYAKDSAITKHLAAFLAGRPQVDAVLFNGGSLKPESIQERLTEAISDWQGSKPVVLPNAEPDLAVARGAASFGWLLEHQASRIQAGAARSLFLEVGGDGDQSSLVCIMPKGTPPEEEVLIDDLDLELQVNMPVSFQLLSSSRYDDAEPGEVISRRTTDFHRLPPLETTASSRKRPGDKERVSVFLSTKLNAVGLLQLECVDAADSSARWPLEFNLSGKNHPAAAGPSLDLGVSEEKLAKAEKRIVDLFSRDLNKRDKLTATRLTTSLEKILGLPKHEWNAVLLRKLWETLADCLGWTYISQEHEEAWLGIGGFLLRPGFGIQFDEERIDQLWKSEDTNYEFPSKKIDLARYVLWRRVSGGLSFERQTMLSQESLPLLSKQKPPVEVVRMVGALERLTPEQKATLCEPILAKGLELAEQNGYSEPFWTALTQLLNRAPIYAGTESVLPPETVATTFDALQKLDWRREDLAGIVPLFLRAARRVESNSVDLPKKLRNEILAKLRKSKVPATKLTPLEKFVEVEKSDQVNLMGESLPPGIVLKETQGL